jgi:uncharacterized protein YcbK (DUF882 family)
MMKAKEFMPVGDDGGISRRSFLSLSLTALAAASFPGQVAAAMQKAVMPPRSLAFYNTHTGESLNACYWRKGGYVPGALAEIDFILRDHRTGEVIEIDRNLLDLLSSLRAGVGKSQPFHIISGYRSVRTNSALRRKSGGVAGRSLHLVGKAADIRLPGCDLATLRAAALELRGGGVGHYPKSDFIHVDVGRVRRWSG